MLINNADQPIRRASIEICNQKIEVKNVPVSKRVSESYKINSDGHFVIDVEFESKKTLHKELGYVTNGFDFKHKIKITENDIEIILQK